MALRGWLGMSSAIIPLAVCVRANRSTSLIHAACWSVLAWLAWMISIWSSWTPFIYLALCLTGCLGVAILGARRPGAGAWNFVVGGLLVVLMMPVAEAGATDSAVQLGIMRTAFLASLIGIAVINYLPTRLGAGALLLATGCAMSLTSLEGGTTHGEFARWCVGLSPWFGWAGLSVEHRTSSPADALWRAFRDRYGLIWSLRLREQFDAAASNAGLACKMRWRGVRPESPAAYELLTALVKRFFDPSLLEAVGR